MVLSQLDPLPRVDHLRSCFRINGGEQADEPMKRWLLTTRRGRPAGCAAANGNPNERSCAMKMNSAQIKQTLNQFEAQAIPAGHPAMPQLERLLGGDTFFLDSEGLNIAEPVEAEQNDRRRSVVVNRASWADGTKASLEPHEPESTE